MGIIFIEFNKEDNNDIDIVDFSLLYATINEICIIIYQKYKRIIEKLYDNIKFDSN